MHENHIEAQQTKEYILHFFLFFQSLQINHIYIHQKAVSISHNFFPFLMNIFNFPNLKTQKETKKKKRKKEKKR